MVISPLRYPGGKAKLFGFFSDLLIHNNLLGCHYCEPYAGGGGLALKLLSAGLVDHVSLNDIDEAVWSFWVSALNHNEELCELIRKADLSIAEWHRQREIWKEKDTRNPLELGYATFYLNRTNRSGIIEGAGPIGGYEQKGLWKLNARFDPEKQSASVRALLPFRSRITISKLDAIDFVRNSFNNPHSLTYLDPPYYVKGSKLYRNSYNHHDHLNIADIAKQYRKENWVISYDAVNPILEMYAEFDPILYTLNYSAGSTITGKEVIFLSDALSFFKAPGFISSAQKSGEPLEVR